MKYQVSGQHKNTGAQMTLEFDADTRAAAEQRAVNSGMEVDRIEEIGPSAVVEPQPSIVASFRPKRRIFPSPGRLFFWLVLLGLAVAAYFNRDEIMQELHRLMDK